LISVPACAVALTAHAKLMGMAASIRERLIGTIRRECLNQLLFWTAADLEVKLSNFKTS